MFIDIKQLLSSEKYLPIYLSRKDLNEKNLPPVAIELHWTSDCNYDCMHCSYGSRRQSRGSLTQDQIQDVINNLISMKASAVYLSGGGEPTLIKKWDDYARQLVDKGIEVSLITNGVALSEKHLDILQRMNYIAVSVYSTDHDEYRKITDSRFFDRQWSLPEFIKSDSQTIVGARCVLNNINFRNIISIYKQAKIAGYDYIIFIPAIDYEMRGIGLGVSEQKEIFRLISENFSLLDPKFTNAINLLDKKINHYSQSDYRLGMKNPEAGCSAIHIRGNVFVNYCGGIWLCQPHIGNPDFMIGNLNDSKFSEIWNSQRHLKIIEALDHQFITGQCRNCRSIAFNRIADQFDHGLINITERPLDPFI